MSRFKELLIQHGQEQVLRFYEELTAEQQKSLEAEIAQLDFAAIEEAMKHETKTDEDRLEMIPTLNIEQIKAREEEFRAAGTEALKQGKLAAVLLAGGQGSRLGFDGPKGTLNVGINRELYLFEILIRNMEKNVRPLGVYMHMYVMTSDRNHDQTVAFFKEHNYFGYPEE